MFFMAPPSPLPVTGFPPRAYRADEDPVKGKAEAWASGCEEERWRRHKTASVSAAPPIEYLRFSADRMVIAMGLRLIVLRHGETDWNQESRYQGCIDTRLSSEGRTQAAAAAQALSPCALTAVYSSPLARARETAEAIARPHSLAVQTEEAFNEICHGAWEGLTVEEVQAAFPDLYLRWRETPEAVTMPNGESLAQVSDRVLGGLLRLQSHHAGETVCLVTHDVPVRLLILGALGLPPERLWFIGLSATGLSEIEYGREWTTLHRMNSVSHLEEIVAPVAHRAH